MRGKGKEMLALISAIKEILEGIQPASVRAVCYRLFVRQLIKCMSKADVDRVGKQLVYAREEGIVPWEWVVDETTSVERVECWRDLEHHLDDFYKEHLKDPWDDQPERLVVVSEKGTVRGTLLPVLQELRVRFLVAHGYTSATAAYNLAQASRGHDRPTRVIYVGDFDPSGLHMSEVDLPQRLKRYGGDIQITRVAITEDDVRRSGLPDFPASDKSKDVRYRWFVENHGARCIEVDAMPPPELRERVRKAILAHIDGDAWERSLEIEQEELAEIGDWKARIMGARCPPASAFPIAGNASPSSSVTPGWTSRSAPASTAMAGSPKFFFRRTSRDRRSKRSRGMRRSRFQSRCSSARISKRFAMR
jgi:hypothetical protein